ncbi:hypothetical protein ['Camptotheca acuminata' phytoplasma]|uniref:hypothetical protein n=1 Tax='Camptotheca acuminata' phytoplasma TaxID=3239192 RepID=UPI00351A510D
MDNLIYIRFLEKIDEEIKNHGKIINVNYKLQFNIFTLFINLLGGLSSVIFMIYIYISLKQEKISFKKNPKFLLNKNLFLL